MVATAPVADRLAERALVNVPVSAVHANPDQPRRAFRGIDELAASIRESGLLQPITLRSNGDGTFVIIAGERRFRAITTLGWETIPAIVVDRDEATGYRLSVLENMPRKDMTPVEEAKALAQLMDTMTATEVGALVGYGADDGGQVTWKVKLLDCIPEMQELVSIGALGQDKAILAARLSRNGQLQVLRLAGRQQLSRREWAGLCDSIYSIENQTDMFPETKVTAEVKKLRDDLADIMATLAKAATRLSELQIDVLVRGNRTACTTAAAQLKELGRAVARVQRQMESEAGIALTLGERPVS